ncbi:MAG: long-chain fatty acid transport protein [Rhodothermales bacterium]|jgi:long-chain fatty acid transport protein
MFPFRSFSAVAFLLATLHLHANGWRNPPDGARALALAGGKIANLDDPSVISHNPANLTLFDHRAFQAAYTLAFSEIEYEGFSGNSEHTKSPWKLLPPNLYYVHPLEPNELVLGLGINSPAGQFTVWDREGDVAKFAPYFAKLAVFDVKPAIGIKVNEHLSLGFGADFYFSKLWADQLVPPGVAAFDTKTEAYGFGVGGNFGVTWQVNERHRWAFTYKSEVDVKYDGDYKVYAPPMRLKGDFDTNIRYPAIATIGYGFSMTENLTIGMDVEWLEFSDFEELSLDNGLDLGPPAGGTVNLAQDWKDTWTAGITAEWKASDTWTWRAGYVFLESPIPDKTFSPIVPFESDRHVLSFGGSYSWGENERGIKKHVLDFAYLMNFPKDRSIPPLHADGSSNPYGGHYKPEMHLFSIGYTYHF